MDWFFAPSSGGREGLTASAVTIFQGDRLSGTVREIIQNSLDAGTGGKVSVGISLALLSRDALPGINRLVPYLEQAFSEVMFMHGLSAEEVMSDNSQELPEDVSFYKRAMELAQTSELQILGFHDWGTSGLTGPIQEKPGQLPGSWLALVRGQGVNLKSESDSLGSFGQGSKAPVSLSRLRTLFYLTQIDRDGKSEDRFIGKALLSSMWLEREGGEDAYLSGGLGYFAQNDEIDPFLNESVPAWARDARSKLTAAPGTTVFVPSPFMNGGIEDFEKKILYAVLLNFFFAIERGRLEVHLPNGSIINEATLREITRDSGILADPSVDEEKLESLKTLYFAKGAFVGVRDSKTFGEFAFAIRVGDDLPGRSVGIARKTGMLITRKPPKLERFPGLGNFDLFVCVTDSRGSKVLRAAENPQHDSFEFNRITESGKREKYESNYKDFATEVRNLIREFAELKSTGRMTVSDLSSLLGTPNEEPDGDNRVEFPTHLRVVGKKRRSKHEATGPGSEPMGGWSGAGGRGSGVRPGPGPGSGDANGDGDGSKGKKMRQATEPLLEVGEREGAHRVFFSVPNPKASVALSLFESGEVSRGSIRFSLTQSGPLVGEVSKDKWAVVGTGNHRFRVDFFPTKDLASIEAWVAEEGS